MIRRPLVILFLLVLAVMVTGVFELKYEVRTLAETRDALGEQIAREREAIRVLEAEWSYLNRPERIQDLARRFLDLAPPQSGQIVVVDEVPFRADDDRLAAAGRAEEPVR